jgi:serine palmitoyltransferase
MNSATATSASSTLLPFFAILTSSLSTLEDTFYKIPGSQVVARYVKSSHQNDPGRTVLELILVLFAIRTLLKSRTRTDRTGKHFISFSEKVLALLSASLNFMLIYCISFCMVIRK